MERHVSKPQEEVNSGRDLSSAFLKVQDVAAYLNVRVSSIYSMTEQRKLPCYRIGRQIRFRKADIDRWMEAQKEEAVDIKIEARKVIRSLQRRKPGADVDRIMKKAIEDTKKKGYTVSQEKPGRSKGLETEVKNGII